MLYEVITGKVTAKRMHELGINTGFDLKQWSEDKLVYHFGKAGHSYYQNARAIDNRPVESFRIRKSVSSETTFDHDIDEYDELVPILDKLSKEVVDYVNKKAFKGRTVTLKLKYADFKIITRSKTLATFIDDYETLCKIGQELLHSVDLSPKIRLIGIGLKNNESEIDTLIDTQLSINFQEDN